MDTIKEAIAIQRICPILQPRGQCAGSGCMAWKSEPMRGTTTEVAWPQEVLRPQLPRPNDMNLEAPMNAEEAGRWIRRKAEEALKVVVGETHEGRRIARAEPVDFHMKTVRLHLEADPHGHCTLIR